MYDSSEFRKTGPLTFFHKHLFKGAGLPHQFLLLTVSSGQQAGKKEQQYLLQKKMLGTEQLFSEERYNRIKCLRDETRESLKQTPSGSNLYSVSRSLLTETGCHSGTYVLVKTQAVLQSNQQD